MKPPKLTYGVLERFIKTEEVFLKFTVTDRTGNTSTSEVHYGKARIALFAQLPITSNRLVSELSFRAEWLVRTEWVSKRQKVVGQSTPTAPPSLVLRPIAHSLVQKYNIELKRPVYKLNDDNVLEIVREGLRVQLDLTGEIERTVLDLQTHY